jgi:hypothetical protein
MRCPIPGPLDRAEHDRGGGDAGPAVVVAQHATEADQSVLARRVCLGEGESDVAGDRRDVDDSAVAPFEHPRKQQTRKGDRRDQVHSDHAFDLFDFEVVEATLELDRRVVDEHVDALQL